MLKSGVQTRAWNWVSILDMVYWVVSKGYLLSLITSLSFWPCAHWHSPGCCQPSSLPRHAGGSCLAHCPPRASGPSQQHYFPASQSPACTSPGGQFFSSALHMSLLNFIRSLLTCSSSLARTSGWQPCPAAYQQDPSISCHPLTWWGDILCPPGHRQRYEIGRVSGQTPGNSVHNHPPGTVWWPISHYLSFSSTWWFTGLDCSVSLDTRILQEIVLKASLWLA